MTAPTLTLPGVTDITATSARPQVKLTYDELAALVNSLFGNDEQGGLWLPGLDDTFTDTAGTTGAVATDTAARNNDSSPNAAHAVQATAGARPALGRTVEGGARNIKTSSQVMNNTAWQRIGVTVADNTTETTAPDGSQTASKVTVSENQREFSWRSSFSAQTTFDTSSVAWQEQTITCSIYAKRGNVDAWPFRTIDVGSGGNTVRNASFDFSTGDFSGVSSGLTATAEALTNDWFRLRFTWTVRSDLSNYTSCQIRQFANSTDGVNEYAYFWGGQIEFASDVTAYQRVGASALDVTESGKPELYYLKDDGIDDSLVATFAASLGTDCTIVRADQTGVVTQTAQTVGTTYDVMAATDIYGLCIVDRALTSGELTDLQAYMAGRRP